MAVRRSGLARCRPELPDGMVVQVGVVFMTALNGASRVTPENSTLASASTCVGSTHFDAVG